MFGLFVLVLYVVVSCIGDGFDFELVDVVFVEDVEDVYGLFSDFLFYFVFG